MYQEGLRRIWRLGAQEDEELELLTPNPNSQNTQEPAVLATQPCAPPARKNPVPAPAPAPAPVALNWKNSGKPTEYIMNKTIEKKYNNKEGDGGGEP